MSASNKMRAAGSGRSTRSTNGSHLRHKQSSVAEPKLGEAIRGRVATNKERARRRNLLKRWRATTGS